MHLTDVSSKYGAPMGRSSKHSPDTELPYKFKLHRIPLDNGGYDSGGAYWGTPSNLYRVLHNGEYDIEFLIRADSRTEAKAQVLARYTNAKFYR